MPIPLRAFSSPSHSPHKRPKIKGDALRARFEKAKGESQS
jgi:hypothetical protein